MKTQNTYQNSEDAKILEAKIASVLQEKKEYHQVFVISDHKSFKAYDLLWVTNLWDHDTYEIKSQTTLYEEHDIINIYTHWMNKLSWISTTRSKYWIIVIEDQKKFLIFETEEIKELLNDNNLPFKENIWIHKENRWYKLRRYKWEELKPEIYDY